jgi:antitoxin component YwqK of YwqJK toxin-antitoxin module
MKKTFTLIIIVLYINGLKAQAITHYYNWKWEACEKKDARFATIITPTDSGFLRKDYFWATGTLQMSGHYKDIDNKTGHGDFKFFYTNGSPLQTGRYINGKKTGTWLSYHYNGMMSDSTTYDKGDITGISLGWHPNGMLKDSGEVKENGVRVSARWFDNGNLSYAGMYQYEKAQGKWKYYHRNGQVSAEEWYDEGVLTDKKYYAEDGSLQADTTNRDRDAVFKSGSADWVKFISSKASFPFGYELVNANVVTVVVAATINEEGEVEDEYLWIPVHPAFDKVVLNTVKKSPKWQPAISHNRRVKQDVRQPMSFEMED